MSPVRIWLDDERVMPEAYTHHAKNAAEAKSLLAAGGVDVISLDFYLGIGMDTGLDVALFIRDEAKAGRLKPLRLRVHSSDEECNHSMKIPLRERPNIGFKWLR